MPYIPKLLGEYIECEQALKEAEKLLDSGSPDANAISRLEMILSADTDAMAMIRMHREYGNRLPVVLEMIAGIRKKYASLWPSEPVSAYEEKLVEPVTDAEMLEGNWAKCVSDCKIKSLEVATAREIAELRIRHGKDSVYCTKGSWVAENFNYLPDGRILVASRDFNPHFKYADQATKEHIANNEFYLKDEIIEGLLEGIKQGEVLLLERKNVPTTIHVDSFGKEPLTAFLGWNEEYGRFLNGCGITNVPLYIADKQNQAFSRALWAGNLNFNSALFGDNSSLNYNICRVSGVSRRSEQSGTGSTGPR